MEKKSIFATGIWASLLSMGVALGVSAAQAQTSGANGTHDPSRMIESNGKLWVYSTGGGSKYSTDGLVWTNGPRVFPDGIPTSVTSLVPNHQGLWAPDIIFLNGLYYYYYSIAKGVCATGLATSPTLDPNSPDYKWTDRGPVIYSPNTTYGAIDPAPFLDPSGNLWLVWGSGYIHEDDDQTIYVTRLDNTTGLLSTTDKTAPGYPLKPGHIEAGYIYYRSPYYYLFWNSGGCCSGASSTYTIHVARSRTVTGPYTETKNNWYKSVGSIHGPGHIGIYDQCGYSRFTYHYYPDNGGSVLGMNELTWGSDGWPVAGPVATTPIKPCGVTGVKGAKVSQGNRDFQVQRTEKGFRLFATEADAGLTAELIDVRGKRLADFRIQSGWNQMPSGMLSQGVTMLRVSTRTGWKRQLLAK